MAKKKKKPSGVTIKKKSGVIIHKAKDGKSAKAKADLMSSDESEHISKKDNKSKNKKGRPTSHGMSDTPTYQSWRNARQRCTNPKHKQYHNYGGRGIRCDLTFLQFYEIMGDRPDGHTLDRIDPDGHYEAGNMRWASPKTQAENRRSSKSYQKQARANIKANAILWQNNAIQWDVCVTVANTHSPHHKIEEVIQRLKHERDLPRFSWKWGTQPDKAYPPLDAFHFPSLTSPGKEVVFGCRPFKRVGHEEAEKRGVVGGLVDTDPEVNGLKREIEAVEKFLRLHKKKKAKGLCFTGVFYPARKHKRYPERFLMALAANFLKQSIDVYFSPMASIVYALEQEKRYNDFESDCLWADCLIIPDFNIDAAKGYGIPPWLAREFYQWLAKRSEGEYQTIIFCHDPHFYDEHDLGIFQILDTAFYVVDGE